MFLVSADRQHVLKRSSDSDQGDSKLDSSTEAASESEPTSETPAPEQEQKQPLVLRRWTCRKDGVYYVIIGMVNKDKVSTAKFFIE